MLVLTESLSVLLQPKLFWLAVCFIFYLLVLKLQCHEISYFFSGTLFLDPFEILSYHLTAESPYWFREEVRRIIDKVFREELMI